MKKKNLIILLLIPFIIALLGMVTINTFIKTMEVDIESIEWNYTDNHGFKTGNKIPLHAKGSNPKNYPLAEGNELVWKVENLDLSITEPIAEIIYENGSYYLYGHKEGEVRVTCSNKKGNVYRQFTAIIYENGAIIITPQISSSQANIDSNIYYGEYDLNDGKKVNAKFKFNVKTVTENNEEVKVSLSKQSSNINVDLNSGTVEILSEGDAYFTLAPHDINLCAERTYKFKVVDNGVNVYTYDDLLNCTNKSSDGEIVVLRKHFQSYENTIKANGDLKSSNSNVTLFGKYIRNEFDFTNDVYQFETTYNQNYIKQWNEFANKSSDYKPISNKVNAGLRIQKDFYGNGYTLNLHNLTYPYDVIEIKDDNGNIIKKPSLNKKNLFRGPLPFYTLGDPNGLPLITTFGQDNIGIFVDGNNITVNDLQAKNCDFGNILSNLDTVGNVLEADGNNILIKNSILSNGKNVIRSFSSNVTIDNCMLQNARNFLITTGSNEFAPVDGSKSSDFYNYGSSVNMSLDSYIKPKETDLGDSLLNSFLTGEFGDKEMMKKSILDINSALNDSTLVDGQYKGELSINNTLFYRSGIASISLDTLFNGPFLYNASPSKITDIFSSISVESKPLVPLIPKNIAGVSYPVKVNVSGNTKFYDYKAVDDIDLSGLIDENISTIANMVFSDLSIRKITIDDIFPLKSILLNEASSNGQIYTKDGVKYINVCVAYYGGGINLSEINKTSLINEDNYASPVLINLLNNYIGLPAGDDYIHMMRNLMVKTVTVVTGQEPFKFMCVKGNGYMFDETPDVSQLIRNVKEGK